MHLPSQAPRQPLQIFVMFPPESSICTKCRHLMCQGPSPRVSNLDQRIPSQSLESSPNFACSDVTEVDCAHQSASAGHLYLSEVHLNPQRQLRPNRTSRKCHTNLLNMFRLITTQTHQIFKMSQCNSLLILLILLLSITSQVSQVPHSPFVCMSLLSIVVLSVCQC